MTLHEVAATGDRVLTLKALRDVLASEIDDCESGRDLAALSRQMTLVLAEIAELAPTDEVDAVDEIAARRNARRSGSPSGTPRAKRSS